MQPETRKLTVVQMSRIRLFTSIELFKINIIQDPDNAVIYE